MLKLGLIVVLIVALASSLASSERRRHSIVYRNIGLLEDGKSSHKLVNVTAHEVLIKNPGDSTSIAEQEVSDSLHCKLLCSLRPDCKSYSFCRREVSNECTLSEADLGTKRARWKLEQVSQIEDDRFSRFDIETEEMEMGEEKGGKNGVRVDRDEQCLTETMAFLDLFNATQLPVLVHRSRDYHYMGYHVLFLLNDLEQCASYCTKLNLRAERQHLDIVRANLMVLKEMHERKAVAPNQRGSQPLWSASPLMSQKKLLCNVFEWAPFEWMSDWLRQKDSQMYVAERVQRSQMWFEGNFAQEAASVVRLLASEGLGATVGGGLCAVTSANIRNTETLGFHFDAAFPERPAQFVHQFETLNLYKEVPRVSLKDSAKSEQLMAAIQVAQSKFELLVDEETELLVEFLRRGDNNQVIVDNKDALECSAECFIRSASVWPLCKSFDIIVERDLRRKRSKVSCQLNAISLGQARACGRQDLVLEEETQPETGAGLQTGADKHVEMFHYEPYAGLHLDPKLPF